MSGKKLNTNLNVAIGVGSPIALNAAQQPPDWIMVLPAGNGGVIPTVDGRGPYRLKDAASLASESLQAAGGRLPIDENHATDLAAPNGGASPARGWVTELQSRSDGIYGRVEWSAPGAALLSERAYRFISPVFTHDEAGTIKRLLRASLVNTPNLRGMAALHSEGNNMDLLAQLRKLLGLADDADEAAVVAKITTLTGDQTATAAALTPIAKLFALQAVDAKVIAGKVTSTLASIARASGLKEDADATAIAAAVTTLTTGAGDAGQRIVALQAELATITTSLNALRTETAKDKATTFVDGAIKMGRVGVSPNRDHYIAMHAVDPARVEKEINGFPILGPGNMVLPNKPPNANRLSLNMEDPLAIAAEANKYRDEQKKLGFTISISDAVNVIKERAQ